MEHSTAKSKALKHGRSLSLPSESNPSTSQFEENLSSVRSSFSATSPSMSSMSGNIKNLQKLYINIDDFLLLPHIHQAISQEESTDQILDGHIRLLDACTSAKELVSNTKQDVQSLLSSLRRKEVNGVHSYLTSRRRSKKMIGQSLKNLRSFMSKQSHENETMPVLYMFKEAETVIFSMIETMFSYLMGTKKQLKQSEWSLISKMMHTKKVGAQTKLNEFDKADSVLEISQEQVEESMNHLKNIDSSIQILEEELECLFRQLIKTRAFLLNILNN